LYSGHHVLTEIREVGELSSREAKQIAELSQKLRDTQMHSYLDRFQIASAKIKGLGSAKKATLRSYGIETAADVSKGRIEAISGFGPATSGSLVVWRQSLEMKFRFKSNQPVDPREIARVKSQIAQERSRLETALRGRLVELRSKGAELTQSRATLVGHAKSVWHDLKQAEADEKAVPALMNVSARRLLFGALAVLTFLISASLVSDRLPARGKTQSVSSPAVQSKPLPQPSTESSPVQTATVSLPPNIFSAQQPTSALPPSLPSIAPTTEPKVDTKSVAAPLPQSSFLPGPGNPGAANDGAVATTPDAPSNPDRSDSQFINSRLIELGYLGAANVGSQQQVQQAIRDFKMVNNLPISDNIDATTIKILNSGSPVPADQSFLGGWSADSGCGQGVELEISTALARTDAGSCRLNRIAFDGRDWKVQARCQVGDQTWPANIRFKVVGRTLEWTSKKGRQIYYRCR
jgi:hypothetical protein